MQLMPATQAQFEVRDPFDPQESLSAGAKLLKQLLDRYHGDLALALSAYNAGMTRVDRTFTVPEIPETKGYVTEHPRPPGEMIPVHSIALRAIAASLSWCEK